MRKKKHIDYYVTICIKMVLSSKQMMAASSQSKILWRDRVSDLSRNASCSKRSMINLSKLISQSLNSRSSTKRKARCKIYNDIWISIASGEDLSKPNEIIKLAQNHCQQRYDLCCHISVLLMIFMLLEFVRLLYLRLMIYYTLSNINGISCNLVFLIIFRLVFNDYCKIYLSVLITIC